MIPLSNGSRRFLEVVANHFCANSSWPEAEELQRSLILANDNEDLVVWDEVGRLPGGFLRRDTTGDGRELLALTVRGLAHSDRAQEELDAFVKLTHHFVDAWKRRDTEVCETGFAEILGVPAEVAARTATILRTEGLIAYAARSVEGETYWRPSPNSVFQFRNIASIDDYLATTDRIMGQPAVLVSDEPNVISDRPEDVTDVSELEESLGPDAKRGFVLMPFVDSLAWLHETIRRAGVQQGVRIQRADDIFEPGVVLDQITTAIDDADVIVSVCTDRNPNVFFEMGYAWRDHRVILVAANSGDLPFDVQHYRTELYDGDAPGQDRGSLEERLRRAVASVLAEKQLPRGRRRDHAPAIKPVVRLSARFENHGGGRDRLVLTNGGTVPVYDVNIVIPDDVNGFHLMASELPLKVLRPGISIPLPAISTWGDGPSVFDVTITGRTENDEHVEELATVSLYG